MTKHPERTFIAVTFLALLLLSAARSLAVPYAKAAYDEKGNYVGCEIGDTSDPHSVSVHNMGEFHCFIVSVGLILDQLRSTGIFELKTIVEDKRDQKKLDSTLFSVEPGMVERARLALKNHKIESIGVEKTIAELEVYDKITVLQPNKAIEVIRNAKIEGALSCSLSNPGGDASRSVIKIPNSEANRAVLKQAGVPHFIFTRNELSGKILALGPLSAVKSAIDESRIRMEVMR